MKHTALFVFMLLLATTATAQVDRESFEKQRQQMREQFEREKNQMRKQYDEERRKAEEEFAAFRQKANEEYAASLRKAWKPTGVQPAVPKPKEPTPPKPRTPAPDKIPSSTPLSYAESVPTPAKLPPVPVPPIPEAEPGIPTMDFSLYGAQCRVHGDRTNLHFSLSSVDEGAIAEAWNQMAQKKYDGLIHDCLAQREALHLGDWGYLQLLQQLSEQLQGKGTDEAILLQMYLYVQSGYAARIARQNGHLVLLVPFNRDIYNYSYVKLDGRPYYVISASKQVSLQVCDVGFPREQVSNILMTELPDFGGRVSAQRTFTSRHFPTVTASVGVDERLMDFLNGYPLSNAWDYYALAGLSDVVKASLYPALRRQIGGKSHTQAAAVLLNFVQTAFDYATDQEQFGYERPLFGDESFFYPKNDCEDRSILFSILVRDLLGLDVMLVHWPGHLAAAVAFTDTVDGDYFTIDGRRFTVCDPTYIGAGIGETMPEFKSEKAKLVML